MAPTISVVTISFNAEQFIERTIQSVIGQTYEHIQYIIIDGASKDNTLSIIKKYRDHIDILVSERDKNLYDAMNKGIQRATGDYILFMNAGDCFYDEHTLNNALAGNQNCDLVYSLAIYRTEEGEERPWHKTTPKPEQLNAKSFLNGMVICHQCMLVKRSIVPLFDEERWKISADLDWSIKVMKQVETKHFYNATFCYYLDGGVSAQNRVQAVKERFAICKNHFGIFPTVAQQFSIAWQIVRRGGVS